MTDRAVEYYMMQQQVCLWVRRSVCLSPFTVAPSPPFPAPGSMKLFALAAGCLFALDPVERNPQ